MTNANLSPNVLREKLNQLSTQSPRAISCRLAGSQWNITVTTRAMGQAIMRHLEGVPRPHGWIGLKPGTFYWQWLNLPGPVVLLVFEPAPGETVRWAPAYMYEGRRYGVGPNGGVITFASSEEAYQALIAAQRRRGLTEPFNEYVLEPSLDD